MNESIEHDHDFTLKISQSNVFQIHMIPDLRKIMHARRQIETQSACLSI
jgi:hypothetical protein